MWMQTRRSRSPRNLHGGLVASTSSCEIQSHTIALLLHPDVLDEAIIVNEGGSLMVDQSLLHRCILSLWHNACLAYNSGHTWQITMGTYWMVLT